MLKWALRILAAVALLAVAALVARIGPAHFQIRRVAPRLPSAEELRTLLAAPGGPTSLRWVLTSSQKLSRGELGHSVFLAEWPDGSLFAVDAGMDTRAALEFGELLKTMSGGGEVTPGGTVPERIGADAVARIRGLGFTHLHIDHTQGVDALCAAGPAPGARVFQSRAQAELRDPNTGEGGALVASSCFEPARAGEEGLLTLADFPGLALIPLGGHTACSTMFAFAVDGRLWLLSGDITNSRADLLANRGKGFLYSGLLVPEDTRRTAELRQYLAALDAAPDITVVVSHDLPALRESGLPEWAE
ncbi:MAG TPA: MBL fold metallo-hydrolase [Myxococcota bacterium]|nr:MBL fold metallo-hydrolase [Myxococcota bacterium]